MSEPIDFTSRRTAKIGNFDGSEQLGCPSCGNVWWQTAGIVLSTEYSVEAFAFPLTCVECEYVLAADA